MATLHTALCDLLQIKIPIIQAPMAVATPALVAAVGNAGGLGMLGLANRDADGIRRVIMETRRLTDRPFGVNFLLRAHEETDARLAACLEVGVPVVSFHWDDALHIAHCATAQSPGGRPPVVPRAANDLARVTFSVTRRTAGPSCVTEV